MRAEMLVFTDRALGALPRLDRPRVLDIGCGTGVPTVRLAGVTGGRVVGIDTDLAALVSLRERAAGAGLADRVHPCVASAENPPFRDAAFDLVWCEGAVFVLGFEASLKAWHRLLRPGGFLVAHDEAGDVGAKEGAARRMGYAVVDVFTLSEETWRERYYRPAEEAHPAILDDGIRAELAALRTHPERFRSAYFVLGT
jgi:SAM-dependent methyltransferase